jgi:hypothetical protein
MALAFLPQSVVAYIVPPVPIGCVMKVTKAHLLSAVELKIRSVFLGAKTTL